MSWYSDALTVLAANTVPETTMPILALSAANECFLAQLSGGTNRLKDVGCTASNAKICQIIPGSIVFFIYS